FKVEHYYNRMRDMEITIAQMGTVMQSMADPVILTDTQHQVIMQNKAAERNGDRKSTRLNSSHGSISYAVFCLKKKKKKNQKKITDKIKNRKQNTHNNTENSHNKSTTPK